MTDKKWLVVGLGQTGQSIARYLKAEHIAFDVFDTRKQPAGLEAFQETHPNVSVYLQTYPHEALTHIEKIICSPGVALDIPLLVEARAQHISIESDIDVFVQAVKAPIIAITGTNGKSTVTTLVGEMAKACQKNVVVAGNIGLPVLDSLLAVQQQATAVDLFVLELSSFQLEITHHLAADVAVFLNLSDDHLDRHGDMASYQAAKQRIYRGAKALVYNLDDKYTHPNQTSIVKHAKTFGFTKHPTTAPDTWGLARDSAGELCLQHGRQRLLPTRVLGQQGIHNAQNALAALAATQAIGLPLAPCLEVLQHFKGLPHRCQVVRTFEEVVWINDSKGTNVGSTQAALEGLGPMLDGELILIAGGQGKGADFSALQSAVKDYVSQLILIGEDAQILAHALQGCAPIEHADSMEAAVACARKHAKPHDIVLLSPACASFDWFDNFSHRGDVFVSLVERL